VDEDIIQVKQLVGNITFRRSEVTVRHLTARELSGMMRTFGSGGLGGYLGLFQSPYLGRFYMLAVSHNDLGLITNKEGKLFVIHVPPMV
jgi:hypothetical protein